MNDRTIENIKNNFYNISKAFEGVEGEELTYQRLQELATENLTPTEMLEKLRQISENKSFDPPINNFFFQAYEHLKSLAELEQKINKLSEEWSKKYSEYIEIVTKKGLNPDIEVPKQLNLSLAEYANADVMKKIIDNINDNISLLETRIEELTGQRKTGDPLEEAPIEQYEQLNGIKTENSSTRNPNETFDLADRQYNSINNQVMKTTTYPDIAKEKMISLYEDIASKQTADALLNVDIKYNADNVEVVLTLEGTNIDETIGKTICTFSDIEDFNKNILNEVFIEGHTSGGLQEEAILDENGDLESINNCDEKLSISGNEDISSETAKKLNEEMKLQKNNSKQRKRVIDNRGYNLINIYIAIIILLVLVAVASFIYLIIFKK